MGSRSVIENAYIAGFLDGDGSIMLQIKTRSDTNRGYRFMATICFYQDSRHDTPLHWIREYFGVGYVTKRNDAMTELRINGFQTVQDILTELQPYIRFKTLQVEAMIRACKILTGDVRKLSEHHLREVVDCINTIQTSNYKAHRKKSVQDLLKILDLTP